MKVLIIRFSSIGDIVLTTPVIRGIKTQLNAEVHFLTKPGYAFLVKHNPYVDKVIDLNEVGLKSVLRSEKYDQVVDLHNNLRSRKLTAGIRSRIDRFNKLNIQKWMRVNGLIRSLPAKHIVDRYLNTVDHLHIVQDNGGLDYFPDPTASLVDIQLPDESFISFAIGGQHRTKQLPKEKISELCKMIDSPIVLLGGPEDISAGEHIETENKNVINHCGQLTLDQSALVVEKSVGLITHDTGMMHIGAALNKPVLSVWGNTIPEFGMYPYQAVQGSEIFEVSGLGCRPCSKIGYDRCPNDHFKCMYNQDLKAISVSASLLLSGKHDG